MRRAAWPRNRSKIEVPCCESGRWACTTTKGHVSANALFKVLKRFDPELTNHGFRNAIKEFCRKAEPPVPDHIADAFCDHSLKGLDASYRRMDTSKERADLSARLYDFVVGVDPAKDVATA
jgi:hypothetical protein